MREISFIFLSVASILATPLGVSAQDLPAHDRAPLSFQIPLPLFTDGRLLGDVSARVSADGLSVEVSTEQIAAMFMDELGQSQRDALKAISVSTDYAQIDQFATVGVLLSYSPETLTLSAELLAADRALKTINMIEEGDFDYERYRANAKGFSGYLNTVLSIDQQFEGDQDEVVRGRFNLSMRPFGTRGFRVGADAAFISTNEEPFQRGRVFVEKEFVESQMLLEAGDLVANVRNLQTADSFAGVAIGRDFGLQPGSFTQPTGRRSFLLERNATVDIVTNGQLLRSLNLVPGQYNLDNLGLGDGANDISVIVRDDTGFEEIVRFTQFFDSNLLRPGLSEYYLSGGVVSTTNETGFEYSDDYVVSGYYRRGVTNSLTTGLSVQAREERQLIGVELTTATPLGNFGTDFAYAFGSEVSGAGANIDYRAPEVPIGSDGRFFLDASFEWFEEGFEDGGAAGLSASGATEYASALRATANFNRRFTISGGGSQVKRHGDDDSSYTIDVITTYGISRRLNLFVGAGYTNDSLRSRDSEAFATVGLSWRFGERGFATGRYDGRRNQQTYQVARSSIQRVGSFGYSGRYNRDGDNNQFGAISGNYVANRGLLDATYRLREDEFGEQSSAATFTMGTAIVTANGKIALSRPVSDAFAIVSPHKSLKGAETYIGRSRDDRIMSAGLFGPAVQPNVPAYVRQGIEYEVSGVPVGVDVGPGRIDVILPRGGGTAIQIGSDANLSVFGVIVDEFGDPVGLKSGVLTRLGDAAFEARTIFTNRSGRFADTSLSPGNYEIQFFDGGSVTFELPDTDAGLVRVGTLELRE